MAEQTPPSRLNPTPPPTASTPPGITPTEMNSALQALIAGRTAAPTSHAVTAPADQKYVAYFDPRGVLGFQPNENYDANAPKLTVYGSADSGYFRLDNAGNAVPVQQPNADALIDKAVDRQIKEGDRNARQRNLETTGFYGTDAERATAENNARARGLDQQRINLDLQKFSEDQKNKDREEKRLSDLAVASITKTGAETGLIGAQTGKTGAETTQIETQTASLAAKTPAEIKEIEARAQLAGAQGDYARAQIEDLKRKAQMPTVTDLGQGATYGVMGPTGQIEERYRQGYVPKTTGEVQARIGQINALANQKRDELMGKVGPNYTAEQAYADFQKWHGQNVQPHIQGLQVAGEEAALTRGKEIATMRTAAYTSALGAGAQTAANINAQAARTVSPGYAEEVGRVLNATMKGERAEPIDMTKIVRPDRDVEGQAQASVAQALKYIDPTAAQLTGAPQPTWMTTNPQAALNMTSLWGTQAAAPAAPGTPAAVPGAVTPAAVAAPAPVDPWAAWRERQTADEALQQRQAQVTAEQQAAQAQTAADLETLMAEQTANDVYAYGGAPVAAPNPLAIARRGVRRPGSSCCYACCSPSTGSDSSEPGAVQPASPRCRVGRRRAAVDAVSATAVLAGGR